MKAILTVLAAIALLAPAEASAQSVLRIGLNDDPDALARAEAVVAVGGGAIQPFWCQPLPHVGS